MSHLVCPLCGKNAPLSTLNPDNLDLDLKVVSFRGLGRGKGFAKAEEHSVIGDEEISPMIARKTLQLCRMFIDAGVLNSVDVIEALSTEKLKDIKSEADVTVLQPELIYPTAAELYYINQINEMKHELKNKKYEINRLITKINEDNKKYEINAQVDYIIKNGVEVGGLENMGVDSNGWVLKISPGSNVLNLYLYEVVQEIPFQIKERLLQHVNSDSFPLWYKFMLVNAPRKKTVFDEMMEVNSRGVIKSVDKDGNINEVIFESIPYRSESYYSISMKDLEVLVSKVKESLKHPEKLFKFYEEQNRRLIDNL